MHHQRVDQACPGYNVGLNINGLDKNFVLRSGHVMVRTVSSAYGTTSAAATAVAKTADEAQPPGVAHESTTTEPERAVYSDEAGPSRSRTNGIVSAIIAKSADEARPPTTQRVNELEKQVCDEIDRLCPNALRDVKPNTI